LDFAGWKEKQMNRTIRSFSFYFAVLMCLCFGMVGSAFAAAAAAVEAGVVVNMEGSLAAKGADGSLRALATGDKVLAGDALFTSKDGYARIRFADGGLMSLRPNSHFKVESFNFDEKQPTKDNASFNLVKGGLRAVSGLIGHRGDPDSYGVKTNTATIGIRGTQYGVQLCQGDCTTIQTPDGTPPADGLHVDVTGGTVQVKNAAGVQLLNAGQFGYVSSFTAAPVVVPAERAISVDIPARMSVDKVPSPGSGGGNRGPVPGGAGGGAPPPAAAPAPNANVCPTG
jgi:hypothetical protein